ncbi:MAG: hypothetical protein LW629_07720 [Burkholderiales bacterium]|nr:hypothetical protein [Burkholderiales bacterium]
MQPAAPAKMPVTTLRPDRQRGGILVLALFGLGIAVSCFTALGLGQMMWQKREIQKIADVAARTAASQLGDFPAFGTARELATNNGLRTSDTLTFDCPTDPANTATQACSSGSTNSRAVVLRTVKPYFFAADTVLRASATAQPSPLIVATISNSLVTLNTAQSALLNGLINAIGGGNINLSAVSYQGLLNNTATVNVLDLSNALGLASATDLVNTTVNLGDFLNLAAGIAKGSDLSAAQVTLNALRVQLNAVTLPVGRLLKLDIGQVDAVNANINLGDLSITGILAGATGRAVNLNLGLPNIASVKVYVTEPPQILVTRKKPGVSPVGFIRTGQIKVEVNFLQNGLSVAGLITALKGGVYLQVGGAEATVNDIRCKMPRSNNQTLITTKSSLALLCLSDKPANFADTSTTPITCGAKATLAEVNVGGLVTVQAKLLAQATGQSTGATATLTGKPPPAYTIPGSNGSALSNLVSQLVIEPEINTTGVLGGLLSLTLGPVLSLVQDTLIPVVKTALSPILLTVGTLLDSILAIPGIAANSSVFEVQTLDCSSTRLIQ